MTPGKNNSRQKRLIIPIRLVFQREVFGDDILKQMKPVKESGSSKYVAVNQSN